MNYNCETKNQEIRMVTVTYASELIIELVNTVNSYPESYPEESRWLRSRSQADTGRF
jgi:hypothetical protein